MAMRSWFSQCLPVASLLALVVAAFVGCGGGPATESVSGKLTMNGQPVTGGTISFAPISDTSVAATEPATAPVNADGTFTVTDGAVAGRHRLVYYPPPVEQGEPKEWDGKGKPPEVPQSEYAGTRVEPSEVEVKEGSNDLTLQLTPATAQ